MGKQPLLIGLSLVVTFAVLGLAFAFFVPNSAVARVRGESIRALSGAVNSDAMENAVGHLGIVFHLADGSWIAIRYVDRHNGDFWSSAVALDSEGRWYDS